MGLFTIENYNCTVFVGLAHNIFQLHKNIEGRHTITLVTA